MEIFFLRHTIFYCATKCHLVGRALPFSGLLLIGFIRCKRKKESHVLWFCAVWQWILGLVITAGENGTAQDRKASCRERV